MRLRDHVDLDSVFVLLAPAHLLRISFPVYVDKTWFRYLYGVRLTGATPSGPPQRGPGVLLGRA